MKREKCNLIYLIGMPASGKTTFGKALSKHLGFDFLDLDALIEQNEQKTIPHIFEEEGENHFREKEKEALRQTLAHKNTVIATGGGTSCFFDNLTKMKANGLVVFLNTPIEVLTERAFQDQKEKASRPLFSGADDAEKIQKAIEEKWNQRKQFYQKAHFEIPFSTDLESQIRIFAERYSEHTKR